MITVFTPTYNRAKLLPRLYESLCRQTYRDFEWVVVDDGSVDDTHYVVESFMNGNDNENGNNNFPIRYFYQENGGKHRAINRGVQEAKGELFLILDSDDSIPEGAIERIASVYQQIRDDEGFGGVCGYMAHHDGTVIGKGNDYDMLDTNTIDLRYRFNVKGDMCEVFRTSVLKENPFPEIDREKFCPEALVWNRIAQKYRLRVFHEVIYYRDYLDNGLTDRIVKIRMNSPIASMMCYQEMSELDIPLLQKIKAAINYWRFRFCSNKSERPVLKWYWNWVMPIGYLLHRKDKKRER
ncbi:MAG: glycosyltransferase family 2 protein [Prevotella sp.]|nr:glycosyltransferase family 2 protein [Prevotella sp.]